jgi:serine/threonine protein kinase
MGGTVYQGLYKGRKVAVKQTESSLSKDNQKAFVDEIQLMISLAPHPNIIQLIGLCDSPVLSVVMELMSWSLYERLRLEPRLDHKSKLKIAIDTACGLDFLHEQGVVHR